MVELTQKTVLAVYGASAIWEAEPSYTFILRPSLFEERGEGGEILLEQVIDRRLFNQQILSVVKRPFCHSFVLAKILELHHWQFVCALTRRRFFYCTCAISGLSPNIDGKLRSK